MTDMKCRSCDGDGYVECPKCGGSGEIRGSNDFIGGLTGGLFTNVDPDDVKECSLCGGSGRKECGACNGTGEANDD